MSELVDRGVIARPMDRLLSVLALYLSVFLVGGWLVCGYYALT